MKFDHRVYLDGVFYLAGTEVPVEGKPIEKKNTEPKKEVETVVVAEETGDKGINKEDILAINNVMKLRKIAKDNNVAVSNDMSLKEIKEVMIQTLNL